VDTFTLEVSPPGQPLSGADPLYLEVSWPATIVGLVATLTENGPGRTTYDLRTGDPPHSIMLNRLTIDADELTSETSDVPVVIRDPVLPAGTVLRFLLMSHHSDARGGAITVRLARDLPSVPPGVFDPDSILTEVARRLNVQPDAPGVSDSIAAAVADVLDYSGRTELPDDPRVRRHMVAYAEAIFLSASAPYGSLSAVGDDSFGVIPVANDLSGKFAPRFAFLSTAWGIA
jgi:hypothetical protein